MTVVFEIHQTMEPRHEKCRTDWSGWQGLAEGCPTAPEAATEAEPLAIDARAELIQAPIPIRLEAVNCIDTSI